MANISKLINEFNEFLKNESNDFNTLKAEKFIEQLKNEIQNKSFYDVITVNYESEFSKPTKKFTFYIGCNKLSRGVTISSLLTTFYFTKSVNQIIVADSTSQAARWLGYRESYNFFLTIFLSKNLYSAYNQINFINMELYNILYQYEKENKSIKNIERKLYIKRNEKLIKATRETVVKQKIDDDVSDSEKLANFRSFSINHTYNDSAIEKTDSVENEKMVKEIILKNFAKNNWNLKNFSKKGKLRNCPFVIYKNLEDFKENISFANYNDFAKRLNITQDLFQKITEKNKNKKIIFALVQNKFISEIKFQNRTIINNKITEIPVGITENYVGDKYWLDDFKNSEEFLIFQIYPIKINNLIEIFKLALIQNPLKSMFDDESIIIIPYDKIN